MSSSTSFIPRPFPPPALADVPLEYIIDQLHRLAPHYWTKPETADCTIIVPHCIPRPQPGNSTSFPLHPQAPGVKTSMHDPSGMGRRATAPSLRTLPRMAMRLHMDYLSSQSSLLRGLFGGASALDLMTSAAASSSSPEARLLRQPNNIPYTLPCPPDHPTIFLPLPDPSSFQLLVHWMYFGSTKPIENALNSGAVTWEGLARNVEYLDIRDDLRVFLGRWYGKWRMRGMTRSHLDDDESDESDWEEDSDDMFSSITSSSAFDTDIDADDEEDSDDEDAVKHRNRGRTRTIPKYTSKPSNRVRFSAPTQPSRPLSR